MNNNTWRHYIGNGIYHEFKNYKVYNAFRWLEAEISEINIHTETKGFAGSVNRVLTPKKGIYSNRYSKTTSEYLNNKKHE